MYTVNANGRASSCASRLACYNFGVTPLSRVFFVAYLLTARADCDRQTSPFRSMSPSPRNVLDAPSCACACPGPRQSTRPQEAARRAPRTSASNLGAERFRRKEISQVTAGQHIRLLLGCTSRLQTTRNLTASTAANNNYLGGGRRPPQSAIWMGMEVRPPHARPRA